jgi:hypothetical protein
MKSINGKTKRHDGFMGWAGSVQARLVDAGARGLRGLDVAGWAQAQGWSVARSVGLLGDAGEDDWAAQVWGLAWRQSAPCAR